MGLCALSVSYYVESASPFRSRCVWGESIPAVVRCVEGKVEDGKSVDHRVVEPGLVWACSSR